MNIIITNNPMVRDKLQGQRLSATEFHDTDCLGVFQAVRDKIHLGHWLLTHPLSGSVKPGETPYKTVIVSGEKGILDKNSLSIIEESIQTCVKLRASVIKKEWHEKILADFQLIDYDLIFG
jgi:hypothetical protein